MSTRFQSIANIQVNQYMRTGGDGTEFQFRPQFITNKLEEGEVALFSVQGVSGSLYVRWNSGKIQQSFDGGLTWSDTTLTEKGAAVNSASPAMVLWGVAAWTSRISAGTEENPEKDVTLTLTTGANSMSFLLARDEEHTGRFESYGLAMNSAAPLQAELLIENNSGDSTAIAHLAFIFKPGT